MDKKTIKNLIILLSAVVIIFGGQFVYGKIVMYKSEFRNMQTRIIKLENRQNNVENYLCALNPKVCTPITSNEVKK